MPSKLYSIAPSLLAADFLHFSREIDDIIQAGADELHVDVMDGHFVPNLTFGPPLIAQIHAKKSIFLDIHLMLTNPAQVAAAYIKAGAQRVTFHVEALADPLPLLVHIKSAGLQNGLALSPATPWERLKPLLPSLDHVLVMSVEPGFSGQTYRPASSKKIAELSLYLKKIGLQKSVTIAVDGGITNENIGHVARQGARAFVLGSTIFKAHDRLAVIKRLRKTVEAALH